MDIGEAGGRNFHGRWFSVGSNFVCHTSALSWHCDSVLGLALLPTPCVSLLPWPLKENFLLANTTVCAVDMQYHVGQTTRERPKLRGPGCGSTIGLSLEKHQDLVMVCRSWAFRHLKDSLITLINLHGLTYEISFLPDEDIGGDPGGIIRLKSTRTLRTI
jgi:hypothetical protein